MLARGKDSGYRDYLKAQYIRTYGRAETGELKLRTRLLVDRLADLKVFDNRPVVLCIGCRNGKELDYIRSKGAADVIGIDVISVRPDILVMDMHALTFPGNMFGLVYACHSLEHALDPAQVGREIVRVLRPGGVVAIEVPVDFPANLVDRNNYRDKEGIKDCFAGCRVEELWTEQEPIKSPRNSEGTSIVRVILRIWK